MPPPISPNASFVRIASLLPSSIGEPSRASSRLQGGQRCQRGDREGVRLATDRRRTRALSAVRAVASALVPRESRPPSEIRRADDPDLASAELHHPPTLERAQDLVHALAGAA